MGVEAQDWSMNKANDLKTGTLNIFMPVVSVAHGATTRVLGQQRATAFLSKLYLPIEREQPEASSRHQSAKAEVKAEAEVPSTSGIEQSKTGDWSQPAVVEVTTEAEA